MRLRLMFGLLTLTLFPFTVFNGVQAQGRRTFTTNFPLNENPISEAGNWINGHTAGVDWKDMRTAGGVAFGTQSGAGGSPYDDSSAVLSGLWGPNQITQGVVRTVNQQTGNVYEEVELRLRTTITASRVAGYEILWRANHDGTQYHQIKHWFGPIGTARCNHGCAFAAVPGSIDMRVANGLPGLYDGDTVGAQIAGDQITTWVIHNGVKTILQNFADASSGGHARFTSGAPGVGHWLRGPGGLIADYGFTSFSASDTPTLPPAAPRNLRMTISAGLFGAQPFGLLPL